MPCQHVSAVAESEIAEFVLKLPQHHVRAGGRNGELPRVPCWKLLRRRHFFRHALLCWGVLPCISICNVSVSCGDIHAGSWLQRVPAMPCRQLLPQRDFCAHAMRCWHVFAVAGSQRVCHVLRWRVLPQRVIRAHLMPERYISGEYRGQRFFQLHGGSDRPVFRRFVFDGERFVQRGHLLQRNWAVRVRWMCSRHFLQQHGPYVAMPTVPGGILLPLACADDGVSQQHQFHTRRLFDSRL